MWVRQTFRMFQTEMGSHITHSSGVTVTCEISELSPLPAMPNQLTIKVRNDAGNLVNIVPLPAATVGMKLSKAKLQGDELNILFEKAA